jgi:hypothetical protein
MLRNLSVMLLIALALILPATWAFDEPGNPNPGVIPINARPNGLSYGEWSARWWDWVLSIPPSMNPLLDTTGAFCTQGQSGHVWFLAETFGGSASRTCTVPAGTMLFFPILNGVFGSGLGDCPAGNPGAGCSVPTLRAAAAANVDPPVTLLVSIDGVPLKDLSAYRATSPVFSYTVTSDNLVGLPGGTYSPVVSDGYWLMLAPLSEGVHTIFIEGISSGGFETDVSYTLHVGH